MTADSSYNDVKVGNTHHVPSNSVLVKTTRAHGTPPKKGKWCEKSRKDLKIY